MFSGMDFLVNTAMRAYFLSMEHWIGRCLMEQGIEPTPELVKECCELIHTQDFRVTFLAYKGDFMGAFTVTFNPDEIEYCGYTRNETPVELAQQFADIRDKNILHYEKQVLDRLFLGSGN